MMLQYTHQKYRQKVYCAQAIEIVIPPITITTTIVLKYDTNRTHIDNEKRKRYRHRQRESNRQISDIDMKDT